MNEGSRRWLVPLTGIGFLVVLIISFIVAGEPKDAKDPANEIANWYVNNKDSVELGAILGIVAGTLLIFFGAYLRGILQRADEGSMLPTLVLIGLTIVAIGGAIDGMLMFAAAEAANDVPATSIQAVQTIWDNDFMPMMLGVLVFVWSAGLAVVRTGALPKWMGWVAIALGIIGVTPIGFVSAMAAALWIVVASILLSLRERSGRVQPVPVQPAPASA